MLIGSSCVAALEKVVYVIAMIVVPLYYLRSVMLYFHYGSILNMSFQRDFKLLIFLEY